MPRPPFPQSVSQFQAWCATDEACLRFNRRRTPMAAFQSLLGLAGQHTPTTYKMLYGPERTG